jgi:hypothetical protein
VGPRVLWDVSACWGLVANPAGRIVDTADAIRVCEDTCKTSKRFLGARSELVPKSETLGVDQGRPND